MLETRIRETDSIKWYFWHFCIKYQFQFYDNKIVVSFYSCLCISVDMDNLSQYCYVSLFLWIKLWFLSNYLLKNLSYKTDLLNSNMLQISSTCYCLIIGLTDLTINIIFVNFFWSVVDLLFQLNGLNRMCFGIHKCHANWISSLA